MNTLRQQQMLQWSDNEWQEWLQSILDSHYEREMRSGYDEKIGTAAIGQLCSALSIAECDLLPAPSHVVCQFVRAMFTAYLNCDLDGEYSSGKSSMGSVFGDIFAQLPENYGGLYGEWLWTKQHVSAAPPELQIATNERLRLIQ